MQPPNKTSVTMLLMAGDVTTPVSYMAATLTINAESIPACHPPLNDLTR